MGWITIPDIASCTRARIELVEQSWPVLVAALDMEGINTPLVQVAVAATVAVECGFRMGTREGRADKEKNPKVWALQERYWPSGYYGRGPIQLTWWDNYRKYGNRIGVDLVSNPDRALEPAIGALILAAFFRDNGIHIAAEAQDWKRVRRLVNGLGMLHYDTFQNIVNALIKRMEGQ